MRIYRSFATAAPLFLLGYVAAQDSHESHESHDEGEGFEAAAVYDVEAGTNSFVAIQAAENEDETLAFMIVPAASADLEGLEGAEKDAEAAWDEYISGAEEPTVLASGKSATPSVALVYQIALEDPLVVVPVEVADAGAYAVFLEHGADEVGTALVSSAGVVLVAGAEEGAEEGADEEEARREATASQWAQAVLATFLVYICSFAGILAIIHKRVAYSIGLSPTWTFASGALLTASLLHIIPEAMEGLESEYESLHDLGLYAGLAILGGIFFSITIHALGQSELSPDATAEASLESLQDLLAARANRSLFDFKGVQPVCWNVLAGELVCFTDGVTIGAAFLSCNTAIGWTVTASTILHEFPQELADFMALLNGGVSFKQAFFFNFLSALTAVLGAVVIMALGGTLTEGQIAFVLLVGAGSFIFIALTELLPGALEVTDAASKNGRGGVLRSQVLKMGTFLIGALLIGLPLMVDHDCEAE